MRTNCVKTVKNSVNNTCRLVVNKNNNVNKNFSAFSFKRVFKSFTQLLLTINNSFYNLFFISFTHFPQTSTNTTINIKGF